MLVLKISSFAICAADERGIPASNGIYFSATWLSSLILPSPEIMKGKPSASISSYVGSRNSSTCSISLCAVTGFFKTISVTFIAITDTLPLRRGIQDLPCLLRHYD
ncbi:Uncharacterised protein [Shigella sonnei]|nr:Uncharacterised protein [Shigella sonnei]